MDVLSYDEMQRCLRDRGWIETKALLDHGLTNGHALEIGASTGYLGLEWLKCTTGTYLTGLDISSDMHPLVRGFLWMATRPISIRPDLITLINASYTPGGTIYSPCEHVPGRR